MTIAARPVRLAVGIVLAADAWLGCLAEEGSCLGLVVLAVTAGTVGVCLAVDTAREASHDVGVAQSALLAPFSIGGRESDTILDATFASPPFDPEVALLSPVGIPGARMRPAFWANTVNACTERYCQMSLDVRSVERTTNQMKSLLRHSEQPKHSSPLSPPFGGCDLTPNVRSGHFDMPGQEVGGACGC